MKGKEKKNKEAEEEEEGEGREEEGGLWREGGRGVKGEEKSQELCNHMPHKNTQHLLKLSHRHLDTEKSTAALGCLPTIQSS